MEKTYTSTQIHIDICYTYCRKISKNRFSEYEYSVFRMFVYLTYTLNSVCECSKGKANDMRYERTHWSKRRKKQKTCAQQQQQHRETKNICFFSLFVCSLCGKQDSN